MIKRHDAEQCFECDICGELLEYLRGHARNPELLLNMRDEFAEKHKPCEQFKDNPARARAEREYKAGMEREMRKAAGKGGRRAPRCNGRTSFRPQESK